MGSTEEMKSPLRVIKGKLDMENLDQLLKSFADLKEQLDKDPSEAVREELMKSIDNLRAQMRQNAKKKARQKEEFNQEAQRKATTIKEGGDLRNNPSDTFKPNSKKNLDSSDKTKSNDEAISTPKGYSKEQYDKGASRVVYQKWDIDPPVDHNDPKYSKEHYDADMKSRDLFRLSNAAHSKHLTKEHYDKLKAHEEPMLRADITSSKHFTREDAQHIIDNDKHPEVVKIAKRKRDNMKSPLRVIKGKLDMENLDQLLKSFADLKEQLDKDTPKGYSKEQYDKHISGSDPDRKRQALMSEHSTKEHTEEALAHKNPMIRNAAIQSKHFTKEHAAHMEANETNNHVRLNAVRRGKEIKPSLSVVKAEYEKDMSIKGKRGVREERRIDAAKAKTPNLYSRLKTFKESKTELVKALNDAGHRQSALLLNNWDEMDANAEVMAKSLFKGTSVGNPDAVMQSEDDKMNCCGMPRKTCKCDIEKSTLGGIKSSGDGEGGDKEGTGSGSNIRTGGAGSFWSNLTNLGG